MAGGLPMKQGDDKQVAAASTDGRVLTHFQLLGPNNAVGSSLPSSGALQVL
jgi:hypothetical protein